MDGFCSTRSIGPHGRPRRDDWAELEAARCEPNAKYPSIPEHDRALAVEQDAVRKVPAHAARQGEALAVAAKAHEIVGRVEMLHADDFLVDDGTGIEFRGHIVAGGADEFHPALPGPLVGIGTHETRQKRVVDIDDSPGELGAKFGG